jgi:putative oxidoreductase
LSTFLKLRDDPVSIWPLVGLVGRLLMGLMLLWSGLGKASHAALLTAKISEIGLPGSTLLWFLSVGVELGGAAILLVGVFLRPAAVLLGIWFLAVAFLVHRHFADPQMHIHFMKDLVLAGGLFVVAAGVDRRGRSARSLI